MQKRLDPYNIDAALRDADANFSELFANKNVAGRFQFTSEIQGGVGVVTYYVSTTGNDANDGSAADDAHAWATIAHAADVVSTILNDQAANFYGVFIQIHPGVYTEHKDWSFNTLYGYYATFVQIQSSSGSTSDVTVIMANPFPAICVWAQSMYVSIYGINFETTTGPGAFGAASSGGYLSFNACVFNGAVGMTNTPWFYPIDKLSTITLRNATIVGSATNIVIMPFGGLFSFFGSLTFVGAVAFSDAVIAAKAFSIVSFGVGGVVGTATGVKYRLSQGSILDTQGNVGLLPGSLAGTVASGAQVV